MLTLGHFRLIFLLPWRLSWDFLFEGAALAQGAGILRFLFVYREHTKLGVGWLQGCVVLVTEKSNGMSHGDVTGFHQGVLFGGGLGDK